MCSERDSPLEPFVLPAPGQPELARLTCGAHLGPPVLTRKQKRPRVNSLVCDRAAAFCAAGPPEALSWMSRWGNLRRRRPAIIDNSRPWGLVLSAILDPDREHFVFEKKYLFHLENSNKTKLMQLKVFETNTSIVNNKKKYMQYI